MSATVLVVSQAAPEGEQANFLMPNGTFFFMLIIFLIVLGVIGKWVVPPVSKVLAEREAMVHQTAADNKKAAEHVAAAQVDYDRVMSGARGEATSIRDEARAEGRKVVDDARSEAGGVAADQLQSANAQLEQTAAATSTQLAPSIDGLSTTLASRILGVDVSGTPNGRR